MIAGFVFTDDDVKWLYAAAHEIDGEVCLAEELRAQLRKKGFATAPDQEPTSEEAGGGA